ncbi:MAG: acylphosphatase [Thermofilum sp. ex4484_82]|nr:acylphosphatase [Thermoproteales archaeon]OYT30397.1 MAG: acylphosphatase [Thermofilum sp. ex4484_82]OYT40027.1 MAG: acylphosphatase [Archaeoglobales archaeon ex4484_92]RLE76207.1 MAG: acylphosphatase [Thermoprotei archaeon]RLE77860.1 MAG: acylphosphatase [Thermoprotei archaeon]
MVVVRAHVFVSGIVQGVFFRANTRRVAKQLGLKGFVRNLRDGRVEAVFEGEEEAVKKAIDWCRKGPPLARVDKVEVLWEDPKGDFEDFYILW